MITSLPRYKSDQVELYCGDCLEILPQLEAGSIDAVVTDPPYFTTISKITVKPNNRKLNEFRWADNFLWIPLIEKLLKPGGSLYVFTGDDQISELKSKIRETSIKIFQRLHWIKTNPMPSFTKRTYLGGVELALFCVKDGANNYFNFTSQNDMHGIWHFPIVMGNEREDHPTQKPVKLIAEWIDDSTMPKELILDPFMGSGTTGVAAVQLGRKFIGIEIDEKYYAIAEKRIREAQLQMRLPL